MALFYETKGSDGAAIYLNIDAVVALKANGKTTIALCHGNTACEIGEPVESILAAIEAMDNG